MTLYPNIYFRRIVSYVYLCRPLISVITNIHYWECLVVCVNLLNLNKLLDMGYAKHDIQQALSTNYDGKIETLIERLSK